MGEIPDARGKGDENPGALQRKAMAKLEVMEAVLNILLSQASRLTQLLLFL